MAIKHIKCPQCGGVVDIDTEKQYAVCQNCGKTLKRKQKSEQQSIISDNKEEILDKTTEFDSATSSDNIKLKKQLPTSILLVIIFSVTIFTIGIMCIIAIIYKDSKNVQTAEQTTTTIPQEQLVNEIIDQQKEQEKYYDIKYKSSKIIKDNGKSYLVVNFIFTNNIEEARSFDTAVMCEAFQGGVQLERGILIFNDNYDSSLSMKKIQPGKSIEVQELFELYNSESTVTVNVNPFFSLTDYHYLSVDIKLK